jgi:predicted permease
MSWIDGLAHRIRSALKPGEYEREIDEEMSTHHRLLSTNGGSVFGNATYHKEEARRMTWNLWLDSIRQDAAYAWRSMTRSPLFTTVAVVTLALGIGASTSIFSVVNAVLLRSLPYAHADRVVSVRVARNSVSAPEFLDMRAQVKSFDAMSAIRTQSSPITGACGGTSGATNCEAQPATALIASPNIFDLLGTRPAIGRNFVESDGIEGAPAVIILSDALWKQRFGGDASVLNTTVTVAGRTRTIVGVMPPGVRFPDAKVDWINAKIDLWIPYSAERLAGDERGNQILAVVARMAPGADIAAVRRDLAAVADRFRQDYPAYYSLFKLPWTPDAVPVRDAMVGEVRGPLLLLAGAVLMVLVIACLNVANLLLARGAARSRELDVRRALGASRGRIVRQLLTESVILGGTGGVLGILLAAAGTRALLALAPNSVPLADGVRLDGMVLLFAVVTSVATGLAFGLAPALRFASSGDGDPLTGGTRGATAGKPRRRVRSAIVAAEVAMAVMLLVTAGLLVRSFGALRSVPMGIETDRQLTLWVTPSRAKYDSAAKLHRLYESVQSRLGALPGVELASAVRPLPLSGEGWSGSYNIEGRESGPGIEPPHAEYSVSAPGYFKAMGIQLVEGRDFEPTDRFDAPHVRVVDEELAKRDWPGESAIGKRISANGRANEWQTIVGVVKHVRRAGARNAGEPQIYIPMTQSTQGSMAFIVRATNDPALLAGAVRAELRSIDSDIPIARLLPMKTVEANALARERFTAALVATLAASALALAAIGLYGVLAYLVAQRTNEIGIRLALGASRGSIVRLIMSEGLTTTLAGLAVGMVGAFALSGVVGTMLFQVKPNDPATYLAINALLVIVAIVACVIPARRALRVDPVKAFRGE